MAARPEIGNLYFLQVGDDDPIKIGWTYGNVTYRVKSLQQSSPHILRWLGACRGPRSDEKSAHRELRRDQLRGEWFHPTPRVLAFLRQRTADFDADAYVREHFRLDLIDRIDRLCAPKRGRLGAVLGAAGIDVWYYWHWRGQSRLLTQEDYGRLETALNSAEAGELFDLPESQSVAA